MMYLYNDRAGNSSTTATITYNPENACNITGGGDPETEHTALTIACYVIGSLGVIGNAFVVIVIASSKSMRARCANIFIINQNCIDGLASVFLIAAALPYAGEHTKWKCKLWMTRLPFWSMMLASTYNLIFLNIDRYIAIVHPMWHRSGYSLKNIMAMLMFPWLFGIAFNCGYMIPTSIMQDGRCYIYKCWTDRNAEIAFGLILLFFQFVLPNVIFLFCYVNIIRAVRLRANSDTRQSSDGDVNKTMMTSTVVLVQNAGHAIWLKAERNSVKTVFIISLSFVLCWILNQALISSEFFGLNVNYGSLFYKITMVLVLFNCCINPFIYALQYKSFQVAAHKLLRRNSQANTSAYISNPTNCGTRNTVSTWLLLQASAAVYNWSPFMVRIAWWHVKN